MYNIKKSVILNLSKAHRNTLLARQKSLGIAPDKHQKNIDISSSRKILKSFISDKFGSPAKKVHTFYNFKGGTGKTTICYQIAEILSLFGYKVLAVDLDPQSHLTNLLVEPDQKIEYNLHDLIFNGRKFEEAVIKIHDGLDLLPSNLGLTKVEIPLSQKARREETLEKLLNTIKDQYDFIMIDTNPAISNLNINAIFAADCINIVCETQPLSLNGLQMVFGELDILSKDLEKKFFYKIIPNKYDLKTTISQEVLGFLKMNYKEHVTENIVRRSEDFNLSSKLKCPLFGLPKSYSSSHEDITDIAYELMRYSNCEIKEHPKAKEELVREEL